MEDSNEDERIFDYIIPENKNKKKGKQSNLPILKGLENLNGRPIRTIEVLSLYIYKVFLNACLIRIVKVILIFYKMNIKVFGFLLFCLACSYSFIFLILCCRLTMSDKIFWTSN